MKRRLIIVATLVACYVVLDRLYLAGRLFAQSKEPGRRFAASPASVPPIPNSLRNPAQGPSQADLALAATIRRLANRSAEGLVSEKLADGSLRLDLKGRFQNVPLVKLDAAGEPVVGCVDSLAGANAFFGR